MAVPTVASAAGITVAKASLMPDADPRGGLFDGVLLLPRRPRT
ncbi:hypothetical protein [Arthrobacter sp. UYEF3]